ncbi:MAG: hypothetical protein KAS66_08955 [Candidatus Omnitrophica bacterium]|nr:hypothetical protein [Candidatus Omnitrophota bacterium]
MTKKKKGYFVNEKDGDYGFSVVANSGKDAKRIAWETGDLDCDYTEVRVTWKRKASVEDLPIGIIENENLALRREVCDYLEYGECEECEEIATVQLYEKRILCKNCAETLNLMKGR